MMNKIINYNLFQHRGMIMSKNTNRKKNKAISKVKNFFTILKEHKYLNK